MIFHVLQGNIPSSVSAKRLLHETRKRGFYHLLVPYHLLSPCPLFYPSGQNIEHLLCALEVGPKVNPVASEEISLIHLYVKLILISQIFF